MKDSEELSLEDSAAQRSAGARRKPWPVFVAAVLLVVVAFLSWYGSWFGRPLTDQKLTEYLNDDEKPRHIQHALDQIVGRMEARDESVRQWYPKIASLANHPVPQVREWAASAMGRDNTSDAFHSALVSMLQDEDRVVRSTAALWLVRFNDASGRPELVEMLKPMTVSATTEGVVDLLIEDEGTAVSRGAPLVRIQRADGSRYELFAEIDSRVDTLFVSDGANVEAGTKLVILSPGVKFVENALTALNSVGKPEDVSYMERYTHELPGMPAYISQQATTAIASIRGRNVP
jgi:hypothetical protein